MKRITQPEIQRNWRDEPVIDGTTYLRPSSLAKYIEDRENLEKWKVRMTAIGLARNPDLLSLVAVTSPDDKRKLNNLAERAQERAGATAGRDTGTAIHAATEAVDYGESIDHMPADLQADALAYRAARESLGLEPLAAEVFVVNEELQAAGTFDRLMQPFDPPDYANSVPPVPTGPPMVTDIKTGSKDDPEYAAKYGAVAWAIQLATYARSEPYGATWEELGACMATPADCDFGIIWYIPRGSRKCYPITVDLIEGWELARTARKVYDARKSSPVVDIREAVTA